MQSEYSAYDPLLEKQTAAAGFITGKRNKTAPSLRSTSPQLSPHLIPDSTNDGGPDELR